MTPGRLLLADRHLGMLAGIHGLLHGLFDTVVMVADERSLADVVATLGLELIVVDLSLPGGREADIVGRLLEDHAGLRLVALSVHDQPEVADWLVAVGVAGVRAEADCGSGSRPGRPGRARGRRLRVAHGTTSPRRRVMTHSRRRRES